MSRGRQMSNLAEASHHFQRGQAREIPPGGSPLGSPECCPWQCLVILKLLKQKSRGLQISILAEASHHFRRERAREIPPGGSPLGIPNDALAASGQHQALKRDTSGAPSAHSS